MKPSDEDRQGLPIAQTLGVLGWIPRGEILVQLGEEHLHDAIVVQVLLDLQ
jgi:hypothetical protein